MSILRISALGFALAFVGACSSDGTGNSNASPVTAVAKLLGQGLFGSGDAGQSGIPNFNIESTFGPAELATMTAPTIAAHIASRDAWSGATLVSQDNGFRMYFTQDQIGLTFRGGILVSTRGINGDLFASDPNQSLAALNAGGSSVAYSRNLRYVSALAEYHDDNMTCTMRVGPIEQLVIARATHNARRFDESCESTDRQVENRFWKAQNGGYVIRSRQWVSESVGYLDVYSLKE